MEDYPEKPKRGRWTIRRLMLRLALILMAALLLVAICLLINLLVALYIRRV